MSKYSSGVGCIICNKPAELDHIRTRGSGGGDESTNLVSLCREHHTQRHAKGILWMVAHYSAYRVVLERVAPEVLERHLARKERRLPRF